MENALWQRQKRPVVDEYRQAASQVERQVAGQGFLYWPGFLGEMITGVERAAKFKLSDINYQIVKEAIERELVQTGHDYDIAVKEAMIAWELEKTQTLTALEQTFADNKKLRALDKEELDRMKIETNLRQLVIIAAKADYQETMEGYRQDLLDIEATTFPYETALTNAKLLTAQKKLEVIPYIESVLEKQQSLIDAEEANADRKEALITAKEAVQDEERELSAEYVELAGKITDLVTAKRALVTARGAIVTAKNLLHTAKATNIGYLESYIGMIDNLIDAKIEVADAKEANLAYMEAYITAQQQIADARTSLAAAKEANIPYMDAYMDALDELGIARVELIDAKRDNVSYMESHIAKLEDELTAKEALVSAKEGTIPHMEQYMAALEDMVDAQEALIAAKQNLIPLMNEKAQRQIAYVAELQAWISAKQAIAQIKEQIADQQEIRVQKKSNVMDERISLASMEQSLKQARIALETARMTGRTSILSSQITNAQDILVERQAALDARITREGALMAAELDFDAYKQSVAISTIEDVTAIDIPARVREIERIAAAAVEKEEEMAELTSETELTSQLVHMLA